MRDRYRFPTAGQPINEVPWRTLQAFQCAFDCWQAAQCLWTWDPPALGAHLALRRME